MNGSHDPEYVAARRVLLDALEALGVHRGAVVLVGAQAIYLRVGAGDMAVAPFTTDGDLALNPLILADEPIIAEALRKAGFDLAVKPGLERHPVAGVVTQEAHVYLRQLFGARTAYGGRPAGD